MEESACPRSYCGSCTCVRSTRSALSPTEVRRNPMTRLAHPASRTRRFCPMTLAALVGPCLGPTQRQSGAEHPRMGPPDCSETRRRPHSRERVDRVADDSSDWFEREMARTGESSKYMMREGKLSKRVWDSLGLSPSEAARAVVGRTVSERTRAMAKVQSPAAEWSSWAGGRDRIVSSVGASRSLEDGERVAGESACCCACEGGEPRQTEGTRQLEGRRLCPDSAASPSSERSPLSSLFLSPLAFLVSTSSLRALRVVMNTSIAWLS